MGQPATPDQAALSTRLRRGIMRGVRAAAGALGEDLLKRSYHSPVVHISELPADVFEHQDPLLGIDFSVERQLAELRDHTALLREFSPPAPDFFQNIMFGSLDAELLHAVVRNAKPRRIVELGSGSTSLVMAQAARLNVHDGAPAAEIRVFDPYPSTLLADGVPGIDSVDAMRPERISVERFTELEADDILFIDTTHTVKVGSEVNYIVLEILPRLASGVHVHFHDIFLPYAYPAFYLNQHLFYVEQYLLQAFLAFNPGFEVRFAAHALFRQHPDAIRDLVPSAPANVLPAGPSSFWIRRT